MENVSFGGFSGYVKGEKYKADVTIEAKASGISEATAKQYAEKTSALFIGITNPADKEEGLNGFMDQHANLLCSKDASSVPGAKDILAILKTQSKNVIDDLASGLKDTGVYKSKILGLKATIEKLDISSTNISDDILKLTKTILMLNSFSSEENNKLDIKENKAQMTLAIFDELGLLKKDDSLLNRLFKSTDITSIKRDLESKVTSQINKVPDYETLKMSGLEGIQGELNSWTETADAPIAKKTAELKAVRGEVSKTESEKQDIASKIHIEETASSKLKELLIDLGRLSDVKPITLGEVKGVTRAELYNDLVKNLVPLINEKPKGLEEITKYLKNIKNYIETNTQLSTIFGEVIGKLKTDLKTVFSDNKIDSVQEADELQNIATNITELKKLVPNKIAGMKKEIEIDVERLVTISNNKTLGLKKDLEIKVTDFNNKVAETNKLEQEITEIKEKKGLESEKALLLDLFNKVKTLNTNYAEIEKAMSGIAPQISTAKSKVIFANIKSKIGNIQDLEAKVKNAGSLADTLEALQLLQSVHPQKQVIKARMDEVLKFRQSAVAMVETLASNFNAEIKLAKPVDVSDKAFTETVNSLKDYQALNKSQDKITTLEDKKVFLSKASEIASALPDEDEFPAPPSVKEFKTFLLSNKDKLPTINMSGGIKDVKKNAKDNFAKGIIEIEKELKTEKQNVKNQLVSKKAEILKSLDYTPKPGSEAKASSSQQFNIVNRSVEPLAVAPAPAQVEAPVAKIVEQPIVVETNVPPAVAVDNRKTDVLPIKETIAAKSVVSTNDIIDLIEKQGGLKTVMPPLLLENGLAFEKVILIMNEVKAIGEQKLLKPENIVKIITINNGKLALASNGEKNLTKLKDPTVSKPEEVRQKSAEVRSVYHEKAKGKDDKGANETKKEAPAPALVPAKPEVKDDKRSQDTNKKEPAKDPSPVPAKPATEAPPKTRGLFDRID